MQNDSVNFPLVSIIIVTFNGKCYVSDCLDAIFKNTYPNYEIIVIDNGSYDDTIQYLNNQYKDKRLKTIFLDKNFGPAYARNVGVQSANGKYLAFLDNDTKPEKEWLFGPILAMEKDPYVGACQCKLMLMDYPDRIDYVGDYLGQNGFLVQRANGGEKDNGQYDFCEEIFSAKSAGMVMQKSVFLEVGGFDPLYFIYVEETDLAWRVWLRGYHIIFIPESVVMHKFSTSEKILGDKQRYFLKYHGCKNYLITLYKNLGRKYLIKIFPIHFLLWFGISMFQFVRGKHRDSRYILKGILYFFKNFKIINSARNDVQSERVVSDDKLFPVIMRKKSFIYFFRKVGAFGAGKGQGWN